MLREPAPLADLLDGGIDITTIPGFQPKRFAAVLDLMARSPRHVQLDFLWRLRRIVSAALEGTISRAPPEQDQLTFVAWTADLLASPGLVERIRPFLAVTT